MSFDFDFSSDSTALGARPPEWNDTYKAKIKKIFDQCDNDKSGTVSLDELGRALAADKDLCRILGIDKDAALPGNEATLREVFAAVDVDGSDELDFDEFGLFFQSRVEILRYLPGTDDEDKFCIIQESIEQIREHANEIHPMAIPGLFNDRIANVKPTVDGLADAILDDVGDAVDCFLEPNKIMKSKRQVGYVLASRGATKANFDAYGDAMLSSFEAGYGEGWTAAHLEAWGKCLGNLMDMYRLGAEDFQKEERDKKQAAIEAAKAAEAEAKAAADQAAIKAAEDAKKAAEKEAAEAQAAIKAAEEAKKAAEKEAAEAQKAVEAAEKKRKEEDEKRAREREEKAKKLAAAEAKKTEEELAAERELKEQRMALVRANQAARMKREAEALKDQEPFCFCLNKGMVKGTPLY